MTSAVHIGHNIDRRERERERERGGGGKRERERDRYVKYWLFTTGLGLLGVLASPKTPKYLFYGVRPTKRGTMKQCRDP